MKIILNWWCNTKGVTAVEYSFIVAGISVAIIAGVFLAGDDLENLWNAMSKSMKSSAGKL